MPVTTWIKMASLCHFQVRKGCLRSAGTKKISLKLYSNLKLESDIFLQLLYNATSLLPVL